MLIATKTKTLLAVLAASILMLTACGGDDEGPGGGDGPTSGADGFDAEAYFQGRTIRMIVPHSAGGGTDLSAREFASHLSDLVPGNPRVMVTNISGLGGIQQAYDAPEDELIVGMSSLGATIYTSLLDPEADIDPAQVRFWGAVTPEPRSGMFTADFAEAYPTLADAQGETETPMRFANVVGSPDDVIDEALAAPWVCEQLDLPCDMISVAEGDSADMDIMVQRGEVNSDWTALGVMGRTYSDLISGGEAYVGVVWDQDNSEVSYPEGVQEAPDLADLLPEESKEEYELLQPMLTGGGLGKNLWVGPAFNDDALEVLKQAWSDYIADEELYAPFDEIQTGGAAEGQIQFSAPPMEADEAQEKYDASFAIFQENRDTYTEIQKRIYDAYWK